MKTEEILYTGYTDDGFLVNVGAVVQRVSFSATTLTGKTDAASVDYVGRLR